MRNLLISEEGGLHYPPGGGSGLLCYIKRSALEIVDGIFHFAADELIYCYGGAQITKHGGFYLISNLVKSAPKLPN
jgi:hypothetical protein